jgi:hypothetical protein
LLTCLSSAQIFSDSSITIEDIMREKGEFIRKGSLSADGDVEFYDDQPDPTADEQEKLPLAGGENAGSTSSSGQQGQQ